MGAGGGACGGGAPLDRKAFAGCSFAIEHFGATVPYWTEGFCDRNVDTFDKELLALMTECAANRHAEFTRDLFSQPVSQHRGISFKFRDEMHALVATLNRCEGHFIRCIKPNGARLPFEFDER